MHATLLYIAAVITGILGIHQVLQYVLYAIFVEAQTTAQVLIALSQPTMYFIGSWLFHRRWKEAARCNAPFSRPEALLIAGLVLVICALTWLAQVIAAGLQIYFTAPFDSTIFALNLLPPTVLLLAGLIVGFTRSLWREAPPATS